MTLYITVEYYLYTYYTHFLYRRKNKTKNYHKMFKSFTPMAHCTRTQQQRQAVLLSMSCPDLIYLQDLNVIYHRAHRQQIFHVVTVRVIGS